MSDSLVELTMGFVSTVVGTILLGALAMVIKLSMPGIEIAIPFLLEILEFALNALASLS